MKIIKYIVLATILISLIVSSFAFVSQGGTLSFSETYTSEEVLALLDSSDKFFKIADASKMDTESSKLGSFTKSEAAELLNHIQSDSFQAKLPENLSFAWGVQEGDQGRALFALKEARAGFTGPVQADIKEVSVRKSDMGNDYSLYISFSEQGTEKWATMTRDNVGRNIAILIDGKVYAAPRVMEEIKGGECSISGNYTESELNKFKAALE